MEFRLKKRLFIVFNGMFFGNHIKKDMKILSLFLAVFIVQSFYSQQNKTNFQVDQMLYYENEDCSNEFVQNKYTVVYQNLSDETNYVVYKLNSFQDEEILLYFINNNKLVHYKQLDFRQYNAASEVEVLIKDMENTDYLEESNIQFKFITKESIVRNHRMLTAYRFKVKNYDNANEIIYYIDHGSSGIPFSYHKGFYESMRKEGFLLAGNVVQRDEINQNGNKCTYTLKSIQKPNKKFTVFSE